MGDAVIFGERSSPESIGSTGGPRQAPSVGLERPSAAMGAMSHLLDALSERIRASLSLPPVPRPLRLPLTNEAYLAHFDFTGRLVSPNSFRNDVFYRGFRPNLESYVFLLLLGVLPRDLSLYEFENFLADSCELYYRLKMQLLLAMQAGHVTEGLTEQFTVIRADIGLLHHLEKETKVQLHELLCTFAMAFPSIGYHKGMAEIANVLLTMLEDEAATYLCFCSHMKRAGQNFANPALLSKQFDQVMALLAFFDPFLSLRLKSFEQELFAGAMRRWLLFDLSREFDTQDVQRVLEMQWAVCMNPRAKGMALSEVDSLELCERPSNPVTSWLFGGAVPESFPFPEFPEVPSCDEGISLEDTCFQMASTAPSTLKSFAQTASSLFASSRSRRFSVSSHMSSATRDRPLSTHARKTFVVSNKPPPVIILDEAITNPFLLFLCTAILIENRDRLMEEIEGGTFSIPSLLGSKTKRFQAETILPRAVHLLKLYLHENRRATPAWSNFLR